MIHRFKSMDSARLVPVTNFQPKYIQVSYAASIPRPRFNARMLGRSDRRP
jgi:hypothetical protein